jgi:hypothetical protein
MSARWSRRGRLWRSRCRSNAPSAQPRSATSEAGCGDGRQVQIAEKKEELSIYGVKESSVLFDV